jgi:hypothetical protein
MAFEETEKELKDNVASLGFDLDGLVQRKKILVDYVHIERGEFHETGEYDLEGIFVRLAYAINSIGAKRVVLDTLEVLFAGLPNQAVLRSELRRLFRRHHCRARARITHPPRPGGICFGLRDPAGPPGQRPDRHPTPACGKISWRAAWY